MRGNTLAYLVLVVVLSLAAAGCATETVLLLPSPENGHGAVVVTPRKGEAVVLTEPATAVNVSDARAGAPYALSEERIRTRYGRTIDALPDASARFLLYFRSGTDELTAESRSLLPEVMQAIAARESTDVSVVGHADREGEREWNFVLSRRRAVQVSELLVGLGANPDFMEITSHGEENPVVPTPDGVAEPLNRRVEVIVR